MIDVVDGFILLRSVLIGDGTFQSMAGSRVYESVAPEGSEDPYVTIQYIPGYGDVKYGDGSIAMTTMTYLIKVTVKGEDATVASQIATRVHDLLQGLAVDRDGYRFNVQRKGPFYQPLVEDGISYRQVGGTYDVLARPLT